MIPRKIHFCWLSNDDFPPLIQHCLNTWKDVLPEYEIILWDTKRFNVNSIAWVKEAYDVKNMLLPPITSAYMLFIRKVVFIWIRMLKL